MNTIDSGNANMKIKARVYNPGKVVGYEQITVDGTVQQMDFSVCKQTPRYAICTVESDGTGIVLRHLSNGEDPTTSYGIPRTDGSVFDVICTPDLARFKVTEAVGAVTILNVEYYV